MSPDVEWIVQEIPLPFHRKAAALDGLILSVLIFLVGLAGLTLIGDINEMLRWAWAPGLLALAVGVAIAGWTVHKGRGRDVCAVGVTGTGVVLRFRRGAEETIPWAAIKTVASPPRYVFNGVTVAHVLEYRDARGQERAHVLLPPPAAAVVGMFARVRGEPASDRESRATPAPIPRWLAGPLEVEYASSGGSRDWTQLIPTASGIRVRHRFELDPETKRSLKAVFGELRGEAEIEAALEWDDEPYGEYTTEYGRLLIDVSRDSRAHVIDGTLAEHVGNQDAEFGGDSYPCVVLRTRDLRDCSCKEEGRPGVCPACRGRGRSGLLRRCGVCRGSAKCTRCPGTGTVPRETLRFYETRTGLLLRSDRSVDAVDGRHALTTRLVKLTPNILASPP